MAARWEPGVLAARVETEVPAARVETEVLATRECSESLAARERPESLAARGAPEIQAVQCQCCDYQEALWLEFRFLMDWKACFPHQIAPELYLPFYFLPILYPCFPFRKGFPHVSLKGLHCKSREFPSIRLAILLLLRQILPGRGGCQSLPYRF